MQKDFPHHSLLSILPLPCWFLLGRPTWQIIYISSSALGFASEDITRRPMLYVKCRTTDIFPNSELILTQFLYLYECYCHQGKEYGTGQMLYKTIPTLMILVVFNLWCLCWTNLAEFIKLLILFNWSWNNTALVLCSLQEVNNIIKGFKIYLWAMFVLQLLILWKTHQINSGNSNSKPTYNMICLPFDYQLDIITVMSSAWKLPYGLVIISVQDWP